MGVRACIKAAEKSEFKKYKLGAIVLNRNGEVLSRGWNKRKTHPEQNKHALLAGFIDRQCLHAEIDAIIKNRTWDSPYTLMVVRIKRDGTLGMARPCPVCMPAIQAAGIRWIEYSGADGLMKKERVEGN